MIGVRDGGVLGFYAPPSEILLDTRNHVIIFLFRNEGLDHGLVGQFLPHLGHSSKCGFQSMSMRKTENLKLTENVLNCKKDQFILT